MWENASRRRATRRTQKIAARNQALHGCGGLVWWSLEFGGVWRSLAEFWSLAEFGGVWQSLAGDSWFRNEFGGPTGGLCVPKVQEGCARQTPPNSAKLNQTPPNSAKLHQTPPKSKSQQKTKNQ